jgi:hypothetical protein
VLPERVILALYFECRPFRIGIAGEGTNIDIPWL